MSVWKTKHCDLRHLKLRGLRESNPQPRFWRPLLYHLTKSPCFIILKETSIPCRQADAIKLCPHLGYLAYYYKYNTIKINIIKPKNTLFIGCFYASILFT